MMQIKKDPAGVILRGLLSNQYFISRILAADGKAVSKTFPVSIRIGSHCECLPLGRGLVLLTSRWALRI